MLKDILKKNRKDSEPLVFPLGKDEKGDVVYCDLAKMPHLLLAAKNSADKQDFFRIMMTNLSKDTSDEVKFFLVDSATNEFAPFAELPNLFAPTISGDADKAISCLNWIVIEMERRLQLFQETSVRDIKGFNEANEEILPRIVVVISELAFLMQYDREDTEMLLCRMAHLGRAAGIHLVIATNCPERNVLSALIKASVPSRISFAVDTADESRWILDQKGAEALGSHEVLYQHLAERQPVKIILNH